VSVQEGMPAERRIPFVLLDALEVLLMVRNKADQPEDKQTQVSGKEETVGSEPEPTPWPQFIRDNSDDAQIKRRLASEIRGLVGRYGLSQDKYCFLGLYDPEGEISSWDLDRIFSALRSENPDKKKNVYLMVVSGGGNIEPAYKISKMCKGFARDSFIVTVPRHAKSAATLIALGADEIHMGLLGELGPIDPQLGKLPALGVKRAMETIAGLAQQYPGSSEAFARYMAQTVTIARIGYCERVGDSAVQYAERLLSKKLKVRPNATKIANELVYEYKDHSFVIDIEEAREHLGDSWIIIDSAEIRLAEAVYEVFEHANLLLQIFRKMRLTVVGSILSENSSWIMPYKR